MPARGELRREDARSPPRCSGSRCLAACRVSCRSSSRAASARARGTRGPRARASSSGCRGGARAARRCPGLLRDAARASPPDMYSSVRMLCRRSASLISRMRMSLDIASSILRKFSAWRSRADLNSSLRDLGEAVDQERDLARRTGARSSSTRGERVLDACRAAGPPRPSPRRGAGRRGCRPPRAGGSGRARRRGAPGPRGPSPRRRRRAGAARDRTPGRTRGCDPRCR